MSWKIEDKTHCDKDVPKRSVPAWAEARCKLGAVVALCGALTLLTVALAFLLALQDIVSGVFAFASTAVAWIWRLAFDTSYRQEQCETTPRERSRRPDALALLLLIVVVVGGRGLLWLASPRLGQASGPMLMQLAVLVLCAYQAAGLLKYILLQRRHTKSVNAARPPTSKAD